MREEIGILGDLHDNNAIIVNAEDALESVSNYSLKRADLDVSRPGQDEESKDNGQ